MQEEKSLESGHNSDYQAKDDVKYKEDTTKEFIQVDASIILEKSPLDKVYIVPGNIKNIKPVCDIIDSKEHMRRNVDNIRFGNAASSVMSEGKFRHEIQVTFHVKRNLIREKASTYIRKHLGSSKWTLDDGTDVTFIRIHEK